MASGAGGHIRESYCPNTPYSEDQTVAVVEECGGQAFLGALNAAERDELQGIGRQRSLRRGETIFHEGDPSDFVVLILEGNVKVSCIAELGAETILAICGAGEIVGEMSAVDGEPRSAQVSALGPVRVQVIPAGDFLRFLEAHPRVLKVVLALISSRLRDADRKLTEFRAFHVPSRIALRLLELSQTHGRQISEGIALDLPLSQQELAEWAGASREAVAKALRLLRERGAIDTGRRAITILRPDLLRRLVGRHPGGTD